MPEFIKYTKEKAEKDIITSDIKQLEDLDPGNDEIMWITASVK